MGRWNISPYIGSTTSATTPITPRASNVLYIPASLEKTDPQCLVIATQTPPRQYADAGTQTNPFQKQQILEELESAINEFSPEPEYTLISPIRTPTTNKRVGRMFTFTAMDNTLI